MIVGYAVALTFFVCYIFYYPVAQYLKSSSDNGGVIKDIVWNDLNFVHMTDTHGWYSGHRNQKQYNADWGDFVSFTKHLKSLAHSRNQDILFVDSGDRHDGNGLSDATVPNGEKSLPIFMKQDFDLLTIGNHELYQWENTEQELEKLVAHYRDHYLSSNVEYKNNNDTFVPLGQRYRYFITPKQHIRILSFGFLFDFTKNNDRTKVKLINEVMYEEWFTEILKTYTSEDVDMIVIVSHVPISHKWRELYDLHGFLRQYYPSTVIQYFGGHSHIRDFTVFDDKLTGLQSGRFSETVGWVSVDLNSTGTLPDRAVATDIFSRSYIDFNLNSFMRHSNTTSMSFFHTREGCEVSKLIEKTRELLDLNTPIGYVKNSNYYVDSVSIDHPRSIWRLLGEKVLPTLKADNSSLSLSDQRLIIINTGSIRYDLYKGPYTLDTKYIVSPFKNEWVKLTLPKHIAVNIAPTLNRGDYIFKLDDKEVFIDNKELLPIHQYAGANVRHYQKTYAMPFTAGSLHTYVRNCVYKRVDRRCYFRKMSRNHYSRGYVTHDDFGSDGDDTIHTPTFQYPVPNVVQAVQMDRKLPDNSPVDVVFYDYVVPNVLGALQELGYTKKVQVEHFSSEYLSDLLSKYIKFNNI